MRQIVLDTETTGLEPTDGHRIIEIGCLEMVERRQTGRNFHVYINPDREVEGGYLEMAGDYGMAVCPWSPLGQGFLTGKYDRENGLTGESKASDSSRWEDNYLTEANFDLHDELDAVADEVGASPAQVALAWLTEWDEFTCVPIVGARTVGQLDENVAAT